MPPIFCYVTERHSLVAPPGSDPIAALNRKIAEVAAAGVDWIQIREKDLSAKKLASLTREALKPAEWHRLQPVDASHSDSKQQASSQALQWHGLQPVEASNLDSKQHGTRRVVPHTRIIVNDRLDVAIAERAGGIHLGENSIPTADTRRLIQSAQQTGAIAEDFLLGVSCHTLDSAKSAEPAGADYIFFGPIFPTPSKAQYGDPQGLHRLAETCRAVSIPVLAIGGITSDNFASCLQAGAAGIAAIRLFQDAPNLAAVIQALH